MLTRVLALLFATIVATSAQTLQPAPQNSPSGPKEEEAQQVQPVSQPSASVDVSVSPTFVTSAPKDGESSDNKGTDADWWMVKWTAAATIIGFVLAVIAAVQLGRQTEQTTEALRYTKEGLDHTISAAKLEQRAWLTVHSVDLMALPAVGETPAVRITFANGGASPALKTCAQGTAILREAGHVVEIPDTPFVVHDEASRSVVGPGGHWVSFVRLKGPLDEPITSALMKGALTLYVAGSAIYDDVFGESHRTKFAYRISGGIAFSVHDEHGHIPLSACPNGNHAD